MNEPPTLQLIEEIVKWGSVSKPIAVKTSKSAVGLGNELETLLNLNTGNRKTDDGKWPGPKSFYQVIPGV